MKERARLRIIRLWRGPLSAGSVARSSGVSESTVHRVWAAAQLAGELPRRARPYFAAVTSPPVIPPTPAADSPLALAIDAEVERSELLAERSGLRIDGADPLLAQLKAVHGRDCRRRLVLRVPDDSGRHMPREIATRADALALARRHDRAIADFAKRNIQEVAA